MDKIYTSLGLMSGTSLDGIDASIIKSDGEKVLNIEKNDYFPFENDFRELLRTFIQGCQNIEYIRKNKDEYESLERRLTLSHVQLCEQILRNYKENIDLVGFHGQTIIHKPESEYSIQMGDARLLSQMLKKKVIHNFRQNDIKNKGSGAPLASIYHYNISKNIRYSEPIIFLNIGGISNITYINKDILEAKDIGPGNVLIDDYIKKKTKKDYDIDGKFASEGKIEQEIIKKTLEHEFYNAQDKHSFDRGDFDYSFVRGLDFKDAVATLTYFTASYLSEFFKNNYSDVSEIIVCGGGRNNITLMNNLKQLTNKKLICIDELGFDGNFIESQAFAYLAIRSFLKKDITFPGTTKVIKSVTGGEVVENF